MCNGPFTKRHYSLRTFGRDTWDIMLHLPGILSALFSRRISRDFAERLMLTASQVNECRYCSYFHSRLALYSGLTHTQVLDLLRQDYGYVPDDQVTGLTFAQHFVETRLSRALEPEAVGRLEEKYGDQASRDIINLLRLINAANLAGNSVDAFLCRWQGCPSPNGHPISELMLFLLFAPFTLPLLGNIRQMEQKRWSV
jgi:AhpD family alkylhydroperoxidase